VNTLCIGSTRSGKSVSQIEAVVKAADANNTAIVVLDPHGDSLAWPLLTHLVARGHKHRIRFDRFSNFKRVLDWQFLTPSTARSSVERHAENTETIGAFTNILLRRSGSDSLASAPLKEEWVNNACWLYIHQDTPPGEDKLVYAFEPDTKEFKSLLENCTDEEALRPFRKLADGKIRANDVSSARRLFRGVCKSPAFAVRCGQGRFKLEPFLNNKGILLVEGASKGNVSYDAMRTMFGAISLRVIRYARIRQRAYPRTLLLMDEATNAGLVTDYEVQAMAECQKMGLDITVLVQLLDFPNSDITKGVLANCLRHEWFYNSSADVLRAAAADLGKSEHSDRADEIRHFIVGQRYVKERHRVWRDRAKLLPDPWGLPGLSEQKTQQALTEIYQSEDYVTVSDDGDADGSPPEANQSAPKTPEGRPCNLTSLTGEDATETSSADSKHTRARQINSATLSPAERLAIEGSADCGNGGEAGSDTLGP
jgi:hypothetical protein